jgi:UDP-N-acetylmuramate: L-alanyl-gamma-D-glutamyl-meso-diaminopimelate ligase
MPKHIHFVGISGVAMGPIAIAFKRAGWRVTGSDKGFFPPVSTFLEKSGIDFYAGWHPERFDELFAQGTPDLAVIGTASGSKNPETAWLAEHHVPLYSFPEILGSYFIRPHSLVCTGTWGKTSSTALLSHIFIHAGKNPTYMFGGISLSHENSAALTSSDWNILEGDEYKSSPTDNRAKFFHYQPTDILLSAVSWDHADLYPTEEAYIDAFRTLVDKVAGTVVACIDHPQAKEIAARAKHVIWYGASDEASYHYETVQESQQGINFTITYKDTAGMPQGFTITSPLLGAFQAENITGCFAMAHAVGGIPAETIIEAIASFKGLKRRLERRYDSDITVIDDIAHSPEKARSIIHTLRKVYGHNGGRIVALFEPNIGGRTKEALAKYDHAFDEADEVIIPRLTKLKIASDTSADEAPIEGDALAHTIAKTNPHTRFIDNDEELVEYLITQTKKGDCIAFLGSHGFRGMIEATVTSLRQQSQQR